MVELQTVDLRDKRLERRLVQMRYTISQSSTVGIPAACHDCSSSILKKLAIRMMPTVVRPEDERTWEWELPGIVPFLRAKGRHDVS
jgi:hypothetical protein